ncbi:hypothetical protein J6590_076964 [Homalodisca vitripennis]|nr:hypothetical protein J6590_076964 [Homalodisca vitripennis]
MKLDYEYCMSEKKLLFLITLLSVITNRRQTESGKPVSDIRQAERRSRIESMKLNCICGGLDRELAMDVVLETIAFTVSHSTEHTPLSVREGDVVSGHGHNYAVKGYHVMT